MIPSIISDLYAACKQPGCPVCHVVRKSVDHYLSSVFYERVNDQDLRAVLRASRGFCNQHAWQALNSGAADALGVAILYQDILTNVLRDASGGPVHRTGRLFTALREKSPKGLKKGTQKLAAALQPRRSCPACVQEDEINQLLVEELLELLPQETARQAIAASDGICLPHLQHALQKAPGEEVQAFLIASCRAHLERLLPELAEFIRKNDYQLLKEATFGPERDAWRRALRLTVGEPSSRPK